MADSADGGLLKILSVGDIAGIFFVPAYQRGYRWTEHEVGQLLEDILDSDGATYYLQPVVVKARDDGSWELVDGQQRLTTLYLIFHYLKGTHLPSATTNYSISYETRPGSKDYLSRLSEADAGSNIDFFHMFRAYRCIEDWFAKFWAPHHSRGDSPLRLPVRWRQGALVRGPGARRFDRLVHPAERRPDPAYRRRAGEGPAPEP